MIDFDGKNTTPGTLKPRKKLRRNFLSAFTPAYQQITTPKRTQFHLSDPWNCSNKMDIKIEVANIIHCLDRFDFYEEIYSAAAFTYALEADKDHSIRRALGQDPPNEITDAIKNLLKPVNL